MTLGGWFRDYVYIPLGGNRVSNARWVFNILVVWMLTGLWHGAAWNFVVWGLLFAVLLVAEKWVPGLKQLPAALSHVYVMLVVIVSFVIFNANSMAQAGQDLAGMFGLAGFPLVTQEAMYYLRSYGLILALAVIGATPLPKLLIALIPRRAIAVLQPLVLGLLLLVCTAYLVDGSYNPFLYFRF
jgi:alginate O-acetyltransferase complex protein AlgI